MNVAFHVLNSAVCNSGKLVSEGAGIGRLKLYELKRGKKTLIDDLEFTNAGCGYGEYGK